MDIVLVTNSRPSLTAQTIRTLVENAAKPTAHMLKVIFDGTDDEMAAFIDHPEMREVYARNNGEWHATGSPIGVGGAKNTGAALFQEYYRDVRPTLELGPQLLCFVDNDMYFLPGWDEKLEAALRANSDFSSTGRSEPCTIVGGWKHPFHSINRYVASILNPRTREEFTILEVDAVTGNCMVMTWADWLKYGPFDANALGPGQSEDFALSRKVVEAGRLIGTISPPVAIHCGIRNSAGEAAPGWREMADMAAEQVDAAGLDGGQVELDIPVEKFHVGVGLNIGSGQRRFDGRAGWVNVDCVSRPPDQVPDVVCDATSLRSAFSEASADLVVLHHVLEHFGCGEGDNAIREAYSVLKPGGSLLIFVPDLARLAGRWLSGELDDFSFLVNVYGAYQGEEGDRHKWGYTERSLVEYLQKLDLYRIAEGKVDKVQYERAAQILPFDWREIPGAEFAKDWWVAAVEVRKA